MFLPAMNHRGAGNGPARRTWRWPVVTIGVVVTAILAHVFGLGEAWQLDWARGAGGEPWRLVTSQLTHWDGEHLFWDVTTFAVLGAVCEILAPRRYLCCLLMSFTILPAVVYALVPDLTAFRGLSGVDCALFALVAGHCVNSRDSELQLAGWLAAGVVTAKVCFELVTGRALFFDSSSIAPVPLAHALGAALGWLPCLVPPKNDDCLVAAASW